MYPLLEKILSNRDRAKCSRTACWHFIIIVETSLQRFFFLVFSDLIESIIHASKCSFFTQNIIIWYWQHASGEIIMTVDSFYMPVCWFSTGKPHLNVSCLCNDDNVLQGVYYSIKLIWIQIILLLELSYRDRHDEWPINY